MSHTPHDKMRELVSTIRNVESSYGRPIGILVDLQGPKLRLGAFAGGSIQLNNGARFVLDSSKEPGDATRVQLPHPEILAALKPGHALLLDDGKVRLIAEETSPDRAITRVVIGGKMSDRKGVSLPDTDLPMSAMTPKDRLDLEAALVTGIDWVALSFVQRADDVHAAIVRPDVDDVELRSRNLDHSPRTRREPLERDNAGLRDQRQNNQRYHQPRYDHRQHPDCLLHA